MTEATNPEENAPQAETMDPKENKKEAASDQRADHPSAAQAPPEEEASPEDPETSDNEENITSALSKKRESYCTDVEIAVNGRTPSPRKRGGKVSAVTGSQEDPCDGMTWTCTCGNVLEASRRRCGECHHWRDGARPASKSTPDEKTWTCVCSTVVELPSRRCGVCYHWKDGVRSASKPAKSKITSGGRNRSNNIKPTRGGGRSEKARSVGTTTPAKSRSTRGNGNSSSKSTRTNSRTTSFENTTADNDNDLRGTSFMECKVLNCDNKAQNNNEGFCRRHFTMIVVGGGSESKASALDSSGDTWICDCGEEMEGKRRCPKCLKRGGMKEQEGDDAKEGGDVHVKEEAEAQDVNLEELEEDTNKDPLKCKIKGCDKFKQSSCNGMCWAHHRKITAKYDNVEPAKWVPNRISSKKRINSMSASPSRNRRNGATNATPTNSVRRSGSGRALSSPKDRYLDDDVSDSSEVKVVKPSVRKRSLDDTFSESSEVKVGRGRKRTREDEPSESALCRVNGCKKYKRAGGYCSEHAKARTVCKFEGCTKYRQTGCDGFCCTHFTTRKSVGRWEVSLEDDASEQGDGSPVKSESLEGVRKTLDETYNVKSGKPPEGMGAPSSDLIFVSSTKRTKNSDGRYICKVVSCKQCAQADGFCKRHNVMYIADPTQFAEAEAAPVVKSPSKKKLNKPEVPHSAKSPVNKKLKSSESRVSFGGEQYDKKTKADNQIKEGDLVMVAGDGPARVIKVHATAHGKSTYDLVNILGGREQGVDGARLTHCSDNILNSTLVSSKESELSEQPLLAGASKNVMLALTRYQLLSGQDCWICTSCSVVVSSLTMSCGVCKMHPSFVPLEFREFEEFVRGQRRKQNRLWFRRKKETSGSPRKIGPNDTSLCRFQGCVQPIFSGRYCPHHVNAVDLVKEQDQPLLSNYMRHLFAQMKTCTLTEDDNFGVYRSRRLGEPGISCRHCDGARVGSIIKGRFFPKDGASHYALS